MFCRSRLCVVVLGAAVSLLSWTFPSLAQQASPVEQHDSRILAKDALDRALLATAKLQYTADRSAFKRRILIALARVDPAAAVKQCDGMSGAADVARAVAAVALSIAAKDPAKALQLIEPINKSLRDIRSDAQRASEEGYLLAELASFNSDVALKLAQDRDPSVKDAVFQRIARTSPAVAAATLKTTPLADRDRRIAQLLPFLATRNLTDALTLADQIQGFAVKSDALAKVALTLAPADALMVIPRIPDEGIRTHAVATIVQRMATAEQPGAIASADVSASGRDALMLGQALAASDPNGAMTAVSRMAFPESRRDALGALVVTWAKKDAAAARSIGESATDLPKWAMPALCSTIAQSDLDGALAKAQAITDPRTRDLALMEIARTQVTGNPRKTEEILFRIDDAGVRLPALRELVISLAPADPDKARSLIGLAGTPQQVQALLIEIAQSLVPTKPDLALEIATACRPSLQRAEFLLDMAAARSATDPAVAHDIAALAVESAAADRVVAVRVARQDPSRAIALADVIEDALQRASAFCDIAEMLLGMSNARQRPSGLVQRIVEPGSPVPIAPALAASAAQVEVVEAHANRLRVRIPSADPDALYTVKYTSNAGTFTWNDLKPGADGTVLLQDDRHLLLSQRLGCRSVGTETVSAIFDDLTKAETGVRQQLSYGIPVSSFGGPGFLSSAPTWIHRDQSGRFWIYQDQRPWKIMAYGPDFEYRFSLVFFDRVLALDTDADGTLYVLQEGNTVSRFDTDGLNATHWQLPEGRGPGEIIHASGLAIDPASGGVFIADDRLARVQQFDRDMQPRPLPFMPWGWIGREDLAYLEFDVYTSDYKYRLDRPKRLLITPDGMLYVDCEAFVARFNLATGRQARFGANDVLGWGGTFMDSPHTTMAADNSHWQGHRLAGVGPDGTVYISDTLNVYLRDLRLQAFGQDGGFIAKYDAQNDIRAADGRRIYIVPPLGMAFAGAGVNQRIWLADGGCRIYEGPGIASGGSFSLGPGINGRQLDLRLAQPAHFTLEKQAAPSIRKAEGMVVTFSGEIRGSRNCETENSTTLANGVASIWIPVRLGQPFKVTLLEEGRNIPASEFEIEIESEPGPFGTCYDFFRVTNKSGHVWQDVRWMAEPIPEDNKRIGDY